jgi:hypothetical protein
MSFFGRPFLEASVGPSIQELCTERIELETDPARNTKGAKDLENSIRALPIWCNKFWANVYKMRDFCPPYVERWLCFVPSRDDFNVQRASSALPFHSRTC